MSQLHHRRLTIVLLAAVFAVVALAGMLYVMRSEINVYMTPTELQGHSFAKSQRLRVGGLVAKGSLQFEDKQNLLRVFEIEDQQGARLKVHYQGVAPSLFKEGKGIIAEGQIQSGELYASMLLAKHDENYKPPGV